MYVNEIEFSTVFPRGPILLKISLLQFSRVSFLLVIYDFCEKEINEIIYVVRYFEYCTNFIADLYAIIIKM